MKRLLPALLLATFGLCPTATADSVRPFDRMDVFALEWVSDPRISPDGERIVYVRNGMDMMEDRRTPRLWLIDTDGSNHVPLTGRDVDESNPVWSPDATRVAFTSEGPNGSEIFVTWVESGKTARLTQLDKSPKDLAWSPDASRIAFSMLASEKPPVLVEAPEPPEGAEWAESPRVTTRLKYERDGAGYLEPGFRQYFVVSALGGTPRQITSGEYRHDGAPRWTPDGRWLIFSGNRDEGWELDYRDSEIYRVDVETGEVTALTDRDGPDRNPVVSPDGDLIAWTSYEDRVQTYQVAGLRIMEIDGSNPRDVPTDLDRDLSEPVWDGSGENLFFQYDDRGDTKIGHTTLEGRARVVATGLGGTTIGRPYGGGSFSVSDDDTLVYTHVTPYRPAELAVLGNGEADELEVLTELNQDLLGRRDLGRVEETWYRSSVDDREIQGWIVYPPGYDPEAEYPLLVENHGGPISDYGARFSAEIQLYAADGYVVFYPNPRGSTGYGEEFGNLLYHDYPGDDYRDVMDGVDHLIRRGLAHEDRLYVTGGSAGGIMTAWIVGKTDRFEAAAVVKPVMNWVSKTLTADNYFMYADYRYPGQPWESLETYMRYSPVSLVGEIETPTLVMVGTDDLRTPISEAKQLYGALKIREVDTALVELPGASHHIAQRPSQLIAKVDHVLAWFDRYREEGTVQQEPD